MDKGDMSGALKAFRALRGYSDAAQWAGECQLSLDYDAAVSMMNNGDYPGARDAFSALGSYRDAAGMVEDCIRKCYALAGQYCDEGNYYSAYVLFTSLGDYLDSAERAAACEQYPPKTGEIYRDSNFKLSGKKSYAVISLSAPDDGQYTLIKISTTYFVYKPVVTLFLAPGEDVEVKLPVGEVYHFKEAYGTVWYGDKELFGDDGTYIDVLFREQFKPTVFSSLDISSECNLYYSLRQNKGNLDGEQISREDF
jgi:hypothetical protein